VLQLTVYKSKLLTILYTLVIYKKATLLDMTGSKSGQLIKQQGNYYT